MNKMIHDIFYLGSGAVFNKKQYTLDEVMIGEQLRYCIQCLDFLVRMVKISFVV